MKLTTYLRFISLDIFIIYLNFNYVISVFAQPFPKLIVPIGHTQIVTSSGFSPDGKYVVTGSEDRTVKIWDVNTGQLLNTLIGHKGPITFVDYNADGNVVASASQDCTIKMWDPFTGRLLFDLIGHKSSVNSLAFSPDGKHLITGSLDNSIKIWELATGKILKTKQCHNGGINYVSFSPDGKQIFTTGRDNKGKIWNASNLKLMQVLKGHRRWLLEGNYSPDGRKLITTSWDGTTKIWDAETGQLIKNITGVSDLTSGSATYSPDGRLIAIADMYGNIEILNSLTYETIYNFQGHSNSISKITFSLDSKLFLTSSWDNTIKIWDTESGIFQKCLEGHSIDISNALFSPDSEKILITSADNSVKIWDLFSGQLVQVLKGHNDLVNYANFSPDGKKIVTASSDKTVKVWDLKSGQSLISLIGHRHGVEFANYNISQNRIVTASWDKSVKIWDPVSGKLILNLDGQSDGVRFAIFSPDNDKILSAADDDPIVKIWNIQEGRLIGNLKGHSDFINHINYSADGKKIVTCSWDKSVKIWDAKKFELLMNLNGHSDNVINAIFSNDGKRIYTTSWDNTARIWDAETGNLITKFSLDKHTAHIISANYSHDCKWLITTALDQTTKIWDTQNGMLKLTLLQLKNNDWLVYDEHYRFDGSPGGIDQLYLVFGLEVVDLMQVKDSLYVPGLVYQIMSGNNEVKLHDKPMAKLENLNIGGLTPLVERRESIMPNHLIFRIKPRTGGLGKVEMYINNNLTYTYTKSQLRKEEETDNYLLEINTDTIQTYLWGKQGNMNPIEIKALIEHGGIYGRPVDVYVCKLTSEQSPKFIGVFVGVNDYNNPTKDRNNSNFYTDLSYAEADAESMAQAMEQSARKLFHDSVLIYRVTHKSNKTPNKQELAILFEEISTKAKAEDILFVFFAGHGGIPPSELNPNGEVRFMLHHANKDDPMFTSFGLSDIKEWIHPQKIKAQKRVFVFDACHSGQFIEDVSQSVFRGDKDEAWRKKQLDKLKDQTGILILAASADNQFSYEDDQLKHGVMTYHLLKQIKEAPKDTTLILNNWFSQSSKDVKFYVDQKYSRSLGESDAPIQTPQIFGRGDFGVGMVTEQVRNSIQLNKVKILMGKVQFMDAVNSIYAVEPKFNEILHQQIQNQLDHDRYDFNPKANYESIGYTITGGTMVWLNNQSINTYTIRYKGKDIKQVSIPQFTSKTPSEIAQKIAESITKELQAMELE